MNRQYPQILSLIIALSTWGNILAALFTSGRLVQELGREGVLPRSSFFASDWPFRTPMAGLFVQWIVSSVYVLLLPPGDAYLFIVSCTWISLIPPLRPSSDSCQFINDPPPSVVLPTRVDQHAYLWGAPVHTLKPKVSSGIWLEPTVPRVHGGGLGFLRIKRVPGGGSIYPTCPWVPGLRTHSILRE